MKKQIQTKTKNGETLIIKLSTDGSSTGPYFSITGNLYEADKPLTDRNCISCGCIHDEILEACPNLKLFIDLHLSSIDGVPMHAAENGFYWLAKAAGIKMRYEPEQDKSKCFAIFMDHCRIDNQEAARICVETLDAYQKGKDKIATSEVVTKKCQEMQHEQGVFEAKNLFRKMVDDMKPYWKQQAQAAIQALGSL